MKLSTRKLTVELMIILCMTTLKVADLQTDCVGTTLGLFKQAGKMALPSESSYAGLWDAYGGLNQEGRRDEAPNQASPIRGNASIRWNPVGGSAGLNLGTAHCELAASGLWTWVRKDRSSE